MLEARAERSTLGAAPDISVVDVGLIFFYESKLLNHTSEKTNDPSTISAQEACFELREREFFLRPDKKSEARNRIRTGISLRNSIHITGDPLVLLCSYRTFHNINQIRCTLRTSWCQLMFCVTLPVT